MGALDDYNPPRDDAPPAGSVMGAVGSSLGAPPPQAGMLDDYNPARESSADSDQSAQMSALQGAWSPKTGVSVAGTPSASDLSLENSPVGGLSHFLREQAGGIPNALSDARDAFRKGAYGSAAATAIPLGMLASRMGRVGLGTYGAGAGIGRTAEAASRGGTGAEITENALGGLGSAAMAGESLNPGEAMLEGPRTWIADNATPGMLSRAQRWATESIRPTPRAPSGVSQYQSPIGPNPPLNPNAIPLDTFQGGAMRPMPPAGVPTVNGRPMFQPPAPEVPDSSFSRGPIPRPGEPQLPNGRPLFPIGQPEVPDSSFSRTPPPPAGVPTVNGRPMFQPGSPVEAPPVPAAASQPPVAASVLGNARQAINKANLAKLEALRNKPGPKPFNPNREGPGSPPKPPEPIANDQAEWGPNGFDMMSSEPAPSAQPLPTRGFVSLEQMKRLNDKVLSGDLPPATYEAMYRATGDARKLPRRIGDTRK